MKVKVNIPSSYKNRPELSSYITSEVAKKLKRLTQNAQVVASLRTVKGTYKIGLKLRSQGKELFVVKHSEDAYDAASSAIKSLKHMLSEIKNKNRLNAKRPLGEVMFSPTPTELRI